MLINDSSSRGTRFNSCSPGVRSSDSVGELHCEIKTVADRGSANVRRRRGFNTFLSASNGPETAGAATKGSGLSELTASIGALRVVDCLKNVNQATHIAPSRISVAAPAVSRADDQRHWACRSLTGPFQSRGKGGASCSSSTLRCWNSSLSLSSSRFIDDLRRFDQLSKPLLPPFVVSARRA